MNRKVVCGVLAAAAAVSIWGSSRSAETVHIAPPEPIRAAVVEFDEPISPFPSVEEVPEGPRAENLGSFTLTAYCPCYYCCGKSEEDPWYGITASGTEARSRHTVAVDPDVIPLGSVLYIGGTRYVAEDVGGAINGKHIDVYFDSHEAALEFGVQSGDVWIWREA